MRKFISVFTILISQWSCVGLIDYPQDLGNKFFYHSHEIYFSRDGNGQNIDSIFADNVLSYIFDNNYIIAQCRADSIISDSHNATNGGFVEVSVDDTIYCLIDKKNCSIFRTHSHDAFTSICDSLHIRMNLN